MRKARNERQETQASTDFEAGPHVSQSPDDTWDAGQMGCGELVLELRRKLQGMRPGQILQLIAQDLGAREDIPAWCRLTGHRLIRCDHPEYWIQRKEN